MASVHSLDLSVGSGIINDPKEKGDEKRKEDEEEEAVEREEEESRIASK